MYVLKMRVHTFVIRTIRRMINVNGNDITSNFLCFVWTYLYSAIYMLSNPLIIF